MAAELREADDGYRFMERLLTSGMITVKFPTFEHDTTIIRIPEVLACSTSRFFRDACLRTSTREFASDTLIGNVHDPVKGLSCYEGFRNLEIYAEWLYTSSLPRQFHLSYVLLWLFGHLLVAPRLQNAVMKALMDRLSESSADSEQDARANQTISGSIRILRQQVNCSPDRSKDLDRWKGNIAGDDKLIDLFLLDCGAWVGIDDADIRSILSDGGDLAIQLYQRILLRATKDIVGAPWDEVNREKYFFKDTVIEAATPVAVKRKAVVELAEKDKKLRKAGPT
ncbi:hypothetical protein LZ554_002029 [Drepanopeziza brunnea f. sp. 'monogermtubi']|nr:hypothetical protein LZ554_002029 [Drepanopeziza brunnea f. sp. 'monogermtubi']